MPTATLPPPFFHRYGEGAAATQGCRGRLPATLAWLGTAALLAALSACTSLPPNTGRTESHALASPAGTLLAEKVAVIAPPQAASRGLDGFRLLADVESAYGSRLALIDAAQKTLDLQYYSIHYDHSTEELLQRLKRAAGRGVRVRVLIDDFNAAGTNAEVLRLDEVPGIEVRLFNPVGGPRDSQLLRIATGSLLDFQRIQQRMHNKSFIADNILAVTGGRNLGDEYFGQGQKSNFLDLDVLVAGGVVTDLSRNFDAYWNNELAYPAATLLTKAEREKVGSGDLRRQAHKEAAATDGTAPAGAGDPTAAEGQPSPATPPAPDPDRVIRAVPGAMDMARQLLDGKLQMVWAPAVLMADKPTKISAPDPDDPDDGGDTVVNGLVDLIQGARQDLLIVSPYFVPGEEMMKTFAGLRARGVRIRVLTNSLASNDAPLAHVGYARYRKALLALGVDLYEMQASGDTRRRLLGSAPQSRSSLHAKTLVMDGRLLVVGTMNLDQRSQLQNTEAGIVVRSRELSRSLTAYIEETLRHSYRLELKGDALRWHVPPEDTQHEEKVLDSEPDASAGLELMLRIIGPFAPDRML
jgi:putative cardiolipin synthase